MIYFAANCRCRLLPSARRTFVHDPNGVETEHSLTVATWLTFMVARTNGAMSERMLTLLRKSAREVVSLDNLKEKFERAVTAKAQKMMRWHGERTDRAEAQVDDLRAQNSKLYQENCEMRAAIRTFNKVVNEQKSPS